MLKAIDKGRWNFTTAAHLLNRAGFGGTPTEIERLADLGPDEAVRSLVEYEKVPDGTADPEWAKPDPERLERLTKIRTAEPEARRQMQMQEERMQRQRLIELRHWWLQRMANGPRPLQEKMTLFWHGHFATSFEKVREAYLMWRQNDLFRKQATGDWLELLIAVGKDPAMLIWLDQAQSRKEHPNENFAREVMELFTLGEGHYTEKDVTEAARAFTGWSFDRMSEEFMQRPRMRDTGEKTVLGRTGDLRGEDVLGTIVAQPQAARFIAGKLWNYFAGEEPTEELGKALAEAFRTGGNKFQPLLATMFRSEEFYAEAIIRNQVKSPVQWVVQSVRVLEKELPPPIICLGLTRNLGQDLFAPPNVKGWDGGRSWITTNTLMSRYNGAAVLAQGELPAMRGFNPGMGGMADTVEMNIRVRPLEVGKILSEEERRDKVKLVSALEKRLLQAKLTTKQENTLREYLDTQSALDDEVIRNTIRLMMSTPEYQLT